MSDLRCLRREMCLVPRPSYGHLMVYLPAFSDISNVLQDPQTPGLAIVAQVCYNCVAGPQSGDGERGSRRQAPGGI